MWKVMQWIINACFTWQYLISHSLKANTVIKSGDFVNMTKCKLNNQCVQVENGQVVEEFEQYKSQTEDKLAEIQEFG